MSPINIPAAVTQRGSIHGTAKADTRSSHSGNSSFDELLSEAQGDSSERKADADAERKARDTEHSEKTDSSFQDVQQFLTAQIQQTLAAQPQSVPPTDAELGNGLTEPAGFGLPVSNTATALETKNGATQPGSVTSLENSASPKQALRPEAASVLENDSDSSTDAFADMADSDSEVRSGSRAQTATPTNDLDSKNAASSSSNTLFGADAALSASMSAAALTGRAEGLIRAGANQSAKLSSVTEETSRKDLLKAPNLTRSSQEITAADANGIPVAMERRVMPDIQTQQHRNAMADATSAPSNEVALEGINIPATQEKPSALRANETEHVSLPGATTLTSGAVDFPGQTMAMSQPSNPSAHATSAEVRSATQVIDHTMQLAERLSLKGSQSAELQMRLHDGKEVTVSLHFANGEWKAAFKTDTEALCRALEQGWQTADAQSSGRSLQFGTPAFESKQTQGNPSGGMDQQSDAQRQSYSRREEDSASPFILNRNRTATVPVAPSRAQSSSAIRLYA